MPMRVTDRPNTPAENKGVLAAKIIGWCCVLAFAVIAFDQIFL